MRGRIMRWAKHRKAVHTYHPWHTVRIPDRILSSTGDSTGCCSMGDCIQGTVVHAIEVVIQELPAVAEAVGVAEVESEQWGWVWSGHCSDCR